MPVQVFRRVVSDAAPLFDSENDVATKIRLVTAGGDNDPQVEIAPGDFVYGEGFPLNGFIPLDVTLGGEVLWAASPPSEREEVENIGLSSYIDDETFHSDGDGYAQRFHRQHRQLLDLRPQGSRRRD